MTEKDISEYTRAELREFIAGIPGSGAEYERGVERLSCLPSEELYKLLNKTQRAFCAALADPDCTIKKAARAAGLSDSSDAVLSSAGSRMLRNVKVAAYRRACARDDCRALGLTRENCLLRLNSIAMRARKKNDLKNELAALNALIKVSGICDTDKEQPDITVAISLPAEVQEYAK